MKRRHIQLAATILLGLAWVSASVALGQANGLPTRTAQETRETLVQVKPAQAGYGSAATSTYAPNTTAAPTLYPVVHVVDGDTIDVMKDGKKVRVRLIGINAPESVDPRRPVQCFGVEASDEMKRLLAGQSVSLETDPSQDLYDKYGRLLAYVSVGKPGFPTGDVGFHMIEAGYAHEYTYRLPYAHQAAYKAAQAAAENAGRGLWAAGACGG